MAGSPLQQVLASAVRHHQEGDLAGARLLYGRVLEQDPLQPDALHLLGVALAQAGDLAAAEHSIRQAIAQRDGVAGYWNHLGQVLRSAGRFEAAIAAYRRGSELPGGFIEGSGGLGVLLREHGRAGEAVGCFERALAAAPAGPIRQQLLNDLGAALGMTGRPAEAAEAFAAILAADPTHVQAQQNLGVALVQAGRLDEGIAACRRAIGMREDLFEAHMTVGIGLGKQGQLDAAVASGERAVQLQPSNPKGHLNLAQLYGKRGDVARALAACERLVAAEPTMGTAAAALAGLYLDVGRHAESSAAFDRAVGLAPADAAVASGRIFAGHFYPDRPPAVLAAQQRAFDEAFGRPWSVAAAPHVNDRSPDRPLRVGYLSPNFNDHVLASLMLQLFTHHDPAAVEMWLYSDVARPVPTTARFAALATRFQTTVGLSDDRVAALVRGDRIDVLVDLTMHMADNRLGVFARRAAPVQVTWCYPGSTGLSAIDYRISDPHLDPPGRFDDAYAERTVRLPDTFFCYDPMVDLPVAAPPHAAASPSHAAAGFVTFGCLNNFCKVNDAVLDLWGRVMAAAPGSRLMLLSPEGDHRCRVEGELARHGVAADRVEHVGRRSRDDYLRLYDRIDLCLDTFPYNGHTTSLDGYHMGVPVVTLVGPTVVGRVGLSQLANLGLTDLVADDEGAFVRTAVGLAQRPDRLAALRATLRARLRASPLMDGRRFARHMEAAYRQMWQTWCAGGPPIGFDVGRTEA